MNTEVRRFNDYMYNLSTNVPNLFYFDSDGMIKREFRNATRDTVWETGVRGNGIHLSLTVRRLVMRELMSALGALCGARGTRFRPSEWLHNVASRRQSRWGRGV